MRERRNSPRPLGPAPLCLAGLVCLALLLVLAPAASAAPRLARPYALSYNLRLSGDATSQDRQVQAVARSAESVRFPVGQKQVQTAPGTFDWSAYDTFVRRLARWRLRLEPVLSSASWGSTAQERATPPASASDFAGFARAFAARFGRGGSFWRANPGLTYLPVTEYEVWNEPNDRANWSPGPDPVAYARLYLYTRAAIHLQDPQARAITGGMAWHDAPAFVAGMYRQPGMRGHVDGVGFHPYGLTVASSYALTRGVRQAVDAADGPSVPLDLTEFGWPSSPSGSPTGGSWVSELTRAGYVQQAASEYVRSDCNINIVSVYSNIGPQSNRADPEQWFGVQNANGTAKPSGAAYDRALRQLAGREAGPTSRVPICHPAPVARPAARMGDWRRRACRIIKTRKQKRAVRRFYRRYCTRRHRAKLRKGPAPPNWRKKTCRRLVNTKRRRRAFRRFHRKSCRRRIKHHRHRHGSRARGKHPRRAGGRSA